MTFEYIADQAADEQAWREARAGKITATDVAKIMTGGPGAWADLKRKKRGDGRPFRGNRFTEWGHEREPFIIGWLDEQHGLRPNSWLLARTDNVTHAATPDAISEQGTMLGEAKTTVKDWPGLDGTLATFKGAGIAGYWWQMQWQMYVADAATTVFAFELHEDFVPAWMEPHVVLVARDDDAIAEAIARVDEWLGFDETGSDAPDGIDELLIERRQLKDAADAAAARVAAVEAELRELITAAEWSGAFEGSAARLSYSGKPVTQNRFDSKAFQARYPNAARRFTKPTVSQPRLTITARS